MGTNLKIVRSFSFFHKLVLIFIVALNSTIVWGFSPSAIGAIASKYGDDFARKLDDFAKSGAKISDNVLLKMGENVEDFKDYIDSLDQARKADLLTEIGQKENLVNDFDASMVRAKIVHGEISDDAVLIAIKNDESFRKFISNDEYFGRWDIDDVPFRKDRMTGGQDAAKSAAQSDVERMNARSKWEAANKKKCNGQVHHIIPVEMIKAKNQKVGVV